MKKNLSNLSILIGLLIFCIILYKYDVVLIEKKAQVNLPDNIDLFPASLKHYHANNQEKNHLRRSDFLNQCAELYVRNIKLFENKTSHEYRIPKIIHQIWIGSPIPEVFKQLTESWQKMHPGWQYKLWTDEDVKHMTLINRHLYDQAKNFGQKADILRAEILYQFGGMYVDIDFECLQPFDMFHKLSDFYTGFVVANPPVIANALIGSIPGHPLLKKYIHLMHVPKTWEHIQLATGPYCFTKALKEYITTSTDKNIIIYPVNYFYPLPATISGYEDPKNRENLKSLILSPYSFAVHFYAGSWIKQEKEDK